MSNKLNPKSNFLKSKEKIGYVNRKDAIQKDYDRIGFMSGLEVHQQLLTKSKLFCRCPAGIYHDNDNFDAELIRHMRPTLSELGEYDGTALMEFKTRKEIVYRINNENACTYEVDDTPPFPIDKEALDISIQISLLSKLNIVGEVHVTRKQYLDGSIPTGFQRTAIIGVEGGIPLKNKNVRLIQLSLEEDSCREISDIGHTRVFKTDRLGMPLIETVTYPDMVNPDEVKEACDYIRFLNRSTGRVRTGIGAGRQDVNVSCKGGSRVEIKGVAHTKWIPELTHIEAYRQYALLHIREELKERISDPDNYTIQHKELDFYSFEFDQISAIKNAKLNNQRIIAVNLPGFKGLLSHFTQPTQCFADEFSGRLKVVACLEHPNMTHSEALEPEIRDEDWEKIKKQLEAEEQDAQIVFWAPDDDVKTALETIEERCQMAFDGVPEETRKSFINGSTIFERVLPGADRMYPDTDTAPIPLEDKYIEILRKNLPLEVIERYQQLKKWNVPEDTYQYIFSKNLYPVIVELVEKSGLKPSFAGTLIGHQLKFVEGHYEKGEQFDYFKLVDLFQFLSKEKLSYNLAKQMLPVLYEHPKMDFDSILTSLDFKRIPQKDIIARIPFLSEKFEEIKQKEGTEYKVHWIMGELRKQATGNMKYTDLQKEIKKQIATS
ncbi:MAG: Glu-tRNA(Gln) amidotransferase subunit GatE [Bacteroidales bacterium]|nr:Glu-tRNA(Gln) amidotransferase subunit GatE [Bacteroidales bacterium]